MAKVSKKSQSTNSSVVLGEGTFEKYLILVGIRSIEYTYDYKTLFDNIEYFRKCHKAGLSAYKSLLFLKDNIN
jgi:hypothetical protein